jgi:hypothetical protein
MEKSRGKISYIVPLRSQSGDGRALRLETPNPAQARIEAKTNTATDTTVILLKSPNFIVVELEENLILRTSHDMRKAERNHEITKVNQFTGVCAAK